jgi:membrane associated rhomboid family serine protease
MSMNETDGTERPGPWVEESSEPRREPGNEPVFNLPGVILALAAAMVAIHVIRVYFVSQDGNYTLLLLFAFIPLAYAGLGAGFPYPLALLWTPVTYSFLHADWIHLSMNLLWMIAFGSPVARRLGAGRFLALSAICSICGAGLHYVLFANDLVPVIGASAAVSGYMGAAARFAFNIPAARYGPGMFRHDGPALGLIESFSNRKFLIFLAVWMVMNLVFGTGAVPLAGENVQVAWQAHIGGFLAGLLFFSLFDPIGKGPNRKGAGERA